MATTPATLIHGANNVIDEANRPPYTTSAAGMY